MNDKQFPAEQSASEYLRTHKSCKLQKQATLWSVATLAMLKVVKAKAELHCTALVNRCDILEEIYICYLLFSSL